MNMPFLVVVTCFGVGCFLSSFVSDLVVTKFLQKILATPKEIRTTKGLTVQDGTVGGVRLLALTKAIGVLGFRCSLLAVSVASSLVDIGSIELVISPACINLVVSCMFFLQQQYINHFL